MFRRFKLLKKIKSKNKVLSRVKNKNLWKRKITNILIKLKKRLFQSVKSMNNKPF